MKHEKNRLFWLKQAVFWQKESGASAPLSKFNELHGDQAEAQDEQQSDHGDSDVVLLVLTGEQGDQGISDAADADAVGDGVGQRHHDQRQESGDSGANVMHINISEALHHQNADPDQSGSGSAGGNQLSCL